MSTIDETVPGDKWAFDDKVTDAFDDMLERSIPAYNVMRDLTTTLAQSFMRADTDVIDLGCSRGAAVEPLVRDGLTGTRFHLVDVSQPMLAAARARFRPEIEAGRVSVYDLDLRRQYPNAAGTSVTLCVLTLQFVPIEYRWALLQRAYDATVPGGALLLVEKVLGQGSRLHETFDWEYLAFKRRNRYTEEQIARKRASLEGVLVSQTADANVAMLRGVGFSAVDCYYRWLNFAGWVAVR